jgi:hypothetical protein
MERRKVKNDIKLTKEGFTDDFDIIYPINKYILVK